MKTKKLLSGVAAAALVAIPTTFMPTSEGWAQVGNITVTTRKREENLQDVPISVNVFGFEAIQRKGIESLGDITRLTAGVVLNQGGGFAPQDIQINIRGLQPTRGRQNAAVILDGVDLSSENIETAGGSLVLNPRLFDVERVEVVKGPQMTLYGRSAFNGAISYITRKPSMDGFEARVSGDFGTHGQVEVTGRVAAPVVEDILAVSINGGFWQHNGFYRNSITDERVGQQEGWGVSGAALFEPTDTLSFTARLEYSDEEFSEFARAASRANVINGTIPANALIDPDGAGPLTPVISAGSVGAASAVLGIPFGTFPIVVGTFPDASALTVTITEDPETGPASAGGTQPPGTDRQNFRAQLNGDWDLGFGTLSSITHFGEVESRSKFDTAIDGSCFVSFYCTIADFQTENKLFSQELRLAGETGAFNWLVGGLFWDEEVTQVTRSISAFNTTFIPPFTLLFTPPGSTAYLANVPSPERFWNRKTKHYSVFGSGTLTLFDQLSATFEARYTWEDLDAIGPSGFGLALAPIFSPFSGVDILGSSSDNYFTPKGTLEWNLSDYLSACGCDDFLLYGSVARAIKAAGISFLGGGGAGGFDPSDSFEQEKMLAYEIGAKSTWFDNQLVVNMAGFFLDFSDKQVATQVIIPTTGLLGTRTVNASAAEVWGLEFDSTWAPQQEVLGGNWTFGASYAWIDATYTEFDTLSGSLGNVTRAGNCTVIATPAGQTTCSLDLSGNRLEETPEHSFVGSVNFTRPIGGGGLSAFIETDVIYQGERWEDEFNRVKFQSYTLVDLRAGLTGENWQIVAYADNLLNDDTVKAGLNTTDFSTFIPPAILANQASLALPNKRQVGVRASVDF